MDEKEVVEHLGQPTEVTDLKGRMKLRGWRCSTCGEVFKSETPVPCPAPCARCEGVVFQKASE